jgi:hypothetical protein
LDDRQIESVIGRYVGAGLERAMAARRMGNAHFARQEYMEIAGKLRNNWSAVEPVLRRVFPTEILEGILQFGV